MMSDSHPSKGFVAGLSAALGRDSSRSPSYEETFPADQRRQSALQERINHRSPEDQLELLNCLTANAGAIDVEVIPLASLNKLNEAIVDLARQSVRPSTVVAWNHPFFAGIGLQEALAEIDTKLVLPSDIRHPVDDHHRSDWRRAAARAAVGITSADYCIAETATLVMRNRPGQLRSASLLPEVHAAVITLDQIIESPDELFALMGSPAEVMSPSVTNCMTWVSGNSKTGDIEATLVPGVHGPKRVVIYVLTGPSTPAGTSTKEV